jgi:hypothetical protein
MVSTHPSRVLNEAFNRKPYQGAAPETAEFVFIGMDANYSADIETCGIFEEVLEYHADGPGFWRKYGVHHPFLLPQYRGDGRRYHHTFAQIGFRPKHAESVSFIELLDFPTVGRNKLSLEDLTESHLMRIRNVIFNSRARFLFLSAGVLRLLEKTKQFSELSNVKREFSGLKVLFEDDSRTVFLHLHFSNYGKFELQLQSEARAIATLIQNCETSDSLNSYEWSYRQVPRHSTPLAEKTLQP